MKIFKKMENKNFTLGVFARGFLSWGVLSGGFVGGICPGGFVLEPL